MWAVCCFLFVHFWVSGSLRKKPEEEDPIATAVYGDISLLSNQKSLFACCNTLYLLQLQLSKRNPTYFVPTRANLFERK